MVVLLSLSDINQYYYQEPEEEEDDGPDDHHNLLSQRRSFVMPNDFAVKHEYMMKLFYRGALYFSHSCEINNNPDGSNNRK